MEKNFNILVKTGCFLLSTVGLITILKYFYKKLKKPGLVKNTVLDLMKNTPLVYIKSLSEYTGCHIYGKCEYYLPFTSKDRMIKNIILDAISKGHIKKDTFIYEGSSGSTGYSVASISRLLGYKSKIVIPDDLSNEKLMLMKTTGCELIETKQCPFSNFKKNFVRYAKKLARKEKGFYVDQFFNTINSKTHYEETGPEIYRDLNGEIDCFVSSAGTGGTLGGISKYLKEKNKDIKIYCADIAGSGIHSYVKNGVMFTREETEAMRKKYRYYSIIEGIGVNFLSDNMQQGIVDESFKVSDEEAVFMANYVYEKDGIFIGGSSAVNLCACVKAAKEIGKGKIIVTVLFDSGLKYVSKLFNKSTDEMTIKSIDQI